jgi:hypothetical protein
MSGPSLAALCPACACTPSDAAARGGSAIEASKTAGHANVSMTGDYTIVQLQRQDELTRAIQRRMAAAQKKQEEEASTQAGESAAAA